MSTAHRRRDGRHPARTGCGTRSPGTTRRPCSRPPAPSAGSRPHVDRRGRRADGSGRHGAGSAWSRRAVSSDWPQRSPAPRVHPGRGRARCCVSAPSASCPRSSTACARWPARVRQRRPVLTASSHSIRGGAAAATAVRSRLPGRGSCARSGRETLDRRRSRRRRRRAPAALTDATPGSRSSTLSTQPARRGRRVAAQDLARRPRVERQRGAERHDRAQPVRRLERLDTHPVVAVAHVQLHALPGLVAQRARATGRATLGKRPAVGGRAAERDERESRGRTGRRRRGARGRGPRARRPAGGRSLAAGRWRPRARPASCGSATQSGRAPSWPCRARRRRLHCRSTRRDYCLSM